MMNQFIRSIAQAIGGAGMLIGAVAWLSGGCADRIAPDDLTPPARAGAQGQEIAVVLEEDALIYEQASGTVLSARHATVSSKILARIDAIPVRAGDVIEAGTLVVRLDARDLAARASAAREVRAAARAALELSVSEHDRIQDLFASNIASRQQLDRTVAAHLVAVAALEGAEQALTDAEVAVSHAEIRAPVGGRVVDRLAEPGDTAAPGAPLLRIYDPGAMRLEAPVREGLAVHLAPEQSLEVHIEALDLMLVGEIDEIVPAAEPGARTFLVKVRLPHSPRLFSGMFGRVRVPAGTAHRIVAPAGAIERIGQLEYAMVADGDGALSRRMVTTGPVVGGERVEILSGLRAGERVLVR
jgi:RND family efflux transporter MFP subunit